MTVTVLTLNLGLLALGLRALDIPVSPHLGARLSAAPARLRAIDADLIALQEVYTARQRHFVRQALRDTHPYASWAEDGWSLLGSGLMVLSRHPVARPRLVPAPLRSRFERAVARMGCLVADVRLPEVGTVTLVNVHLTVGGALRRPSVQDRAERRLVEIEHVLAVAGRHGEERAIILGDFNCGPEAWRECYVRILAEGYVDAYAAAAPPALRDAATWAAGNPLNATGRYRHAPSQRIDHVFLSPTAAPLLAPVAARIVFDEPSLVTRQGRRVPLSDHYGVLVALGRG